MGGGRGVGVGGVVGGVGGGEGAGGGGGGGGGIAACVDLFLSQVVVIKYKETEIE